MTRLYFAYGSNLNTLDRTAWLDRNDFSPICIRPLAPARLPDHELCFDYDSPSRGGGALNLRDSKGSLVHGVLFEVTPEGWDALDRKEGVGGGYYQRQEVQVQTRDGRLVPAITYVACDHRREGFVRPTNAYTDLVVSGCREHGIPSQPVVDAARNLSNGQVDAVFVYGTLLRGESRSQVLAQADPECILLARTFGELYDLGSFPGMRLNANRSSMVEGEFVRVRDIQSTLDRLDAIEGYVGPGHPQNLYRRELVDVDAGDGRMRKAWTYIFCGAPQALSRIPSGDWREHRGMRQEFIQELAAAHHQGRERDLAQCLARRLPWSFNPNSIENLTPLWKALASGSLSERRLAQESGRWAVQP